MTFRGTKTNINSALNNLVFTPDANYNGDASIQIITKDLGHNGSGGAQQDTDTIAITVNPVNDAPTDIALSGSSVNENQSSGTAVGTFSSTDVDTGQTYTYSLVTGTGDTDNASFTIEGNTLKTAASFDYETKSSYSILVQTDDGNGGTFQKVFSITVNNVNDAPTDITLSAGNVNENQPSGTAVGTFSATDQDGGPAYTYTLVSGTGSTDNASFTIEGNTLKTAASFDYETKSSYSILVQTDDGNGGTFQKVFSIAVNNVNDAPTATDGTVTTIEDTPYVFHRSDFHFTDVDSGDTLQKVQITQLESAGYLKLNGVDVTLNQEITAADISAGKLTFDPASNANGAGYANFQFKVSDGTAYSAVPNTMMIDVTAVNDAPTASDGTVTTGEDTPYVFHRSDFHFADVDSGDTLQKVQVTQLESAGYLKLNGVDVTLNQEITAADISAGKLTFDPASNANGAGYANFQFKVSDGTAYSAVTNTMTIDVTAVNDAPTASDGTVTTGEDTPYVFHRSDFHFADVDSGDTLQKVQVTQLESAGYLKLNGVDVTLNQEITAADISAGKLTFDPASNANGAGYANFQFKVSDGTDYSAVANTMTIDVTAVNDAPTIGAPVSVSTAEGGSISLTGLNQITISDAENNQVSVTLTVGHGVLTAGAESGSSITFTGLPAEVTTALSNLSYSPGHDYHGSDSISLTVHEGSFFDHFTSDQIQVIQGSSGVSENGGVLDLTTQAERQNVGVMVNNAGITNGDIEASVKLTGGLSGGYGIYYRASSQDGLVSGYVFQFDPGVGGNNSVVGAEFIVRDSANDNSPARVFMTDVMGAGFDLNAEHQISISVQGTHQIIKVDGIVVLDFSDSLYTAGGVGFKAWTNTSSDVGLTEISSLNVTASSPVTSANIGVTVNSVNDAPTGLAHTVSMFEDGVYTLQGSDFGFRDLYDYPANAFAGVKITGIPSAGSLTLFNGASNIPVTVDQIISIADITAGKLKFSPAPNSSGANYDHFMFAVMDDGETLNGGINTDTVPKTMTFNVTPLNDPPTITSPTQVSTTGSAPYTFNNAISISDANDVSDPASEQLFVRLVTNHGTLSLNPSQVGGLTFLLGTGTRSSDVAFEGTISQVNAALNGLVFTPQSGYSGLANISILTTDMGNNGLSGGGGEGLGYSNIDVYVNSAGPFAANQASVVAFSGIAPASTAANTAVVFSSGNGQAISVSDADAGSNQIAVSLIANNGTLTLGHTDGLSIGEGDGINDSVIRFRGTIAAINNALDGLVFQPNKGFVTGRGSFHSRRL